MDCCEPTSNFHIRATSDITRTPNRPSFTPPPPSPHPQSPLQTQSPRSPLLGLVPPHSVQLNCGLRTAAKRGLQITLNPRPPTTPHTYLAPTTHPSPPPIPPAPLRPPPASPLHLKNFHLHPPSSCTPRPPVPPSLPPLSFPLPPPPPPPTQIETPSAQTNNYNNVRATTLRTTHIRVARGR